MVAKFPLKKKIQSSFATLTSVRCSFVLKKYASVPFSDLLAFHLGRIIWAFSSLLLKFFATSKLTKNGNMEYVLDASFVVTLKNIHEEE